MLQGSFDAVTTAADWTQTVQIYDTDTKALLDLSDVTAITMQVRDRNRAVVLSATLGDGIAMVDIGTFRFSFPVETMAGVCPGTYSVGVTMVKSGETVQIILGDVPVLDGVVR